MKIYRTRVAKLAGISTASLDNYRKLGIINMDDPDVLKVAKKIKLLRRKGLTQNKIAGVIGVASGKGQIPKRPTKDIDKETFAKIIAIALNVGNNLETTIKESFPKVKLSADMKLDIHSYLVNYTRWAVDGMK